MSQQEQDRIDQLAAKLRSSYGDALGESHTRHHIKTHPYENLPEERRAKWRAMARAALAWMGPEPGNEPVDLRSYGHAMARALELAGLGHSPHSGGPLDDSSYEFDVETPEGGPALHIELSYYESTLAGS